MCECRVFGSFASDLQQAKVTTVPNVLVHVESISTEYFMRPCTGGEIALCIVENWPMNARILLLAFYFYL